MMNSWKLFLPNKVTAFGLELKARQVCCQSINLSLLISKTEMHKKIEKGLTNMEKTLKFSRKAIIFMVSLIMLMAMILVMSNPAYAAAPAGNWTVTPTNSSNTTVVGNDIYTTDGLFDITFALTDITPTTSLDLEYSWGDTSYSESVAQLTNGEVAISYEVDMSDDKGMATLNLQASVNGSTTDYATKSYTIYYGSAATGLSAIAIDTDKTTEESKNVSGSTVTFNVPADTTTLDLVKATLPTSQTVAKVTIKATGLTETTILDGTTTQWTTGANLTAASTNFTISVYPENGDSAATYTLTVAKDDAFAGIDMRLTGKEGGTYLARATASGSKKFNYATTEYSFDLDEDEEEVELSVYFDSAVYSVEVKNGSKTITNGSGSNPRVYDLNVDPDDPDKIIVTVKNNNTNTSRTYTLTPEGVSGTSALEDLYINLGSKYSNKNSDEITFLPKVSKDHTSYVALVPNTNTNKIYVTFTLKNKSVDLIINDVSSTTPVDLNGDDEYGHAFDIPKAGNSTTYRFSVDGVSYSLAVYHAPSKADDDANLSDLAVRTKASKSSSNDLALSPAFSKNTTSYYVADAKDQKKLYLYPDADKDMLVFVNDVLLTGSYWEFNPKDHDKVEITVYAEDLETSKTYTLNLKEGSGTLSTLMLYGNNSLLTLSPSFNSNTRNYVTSVASSVASVSLVANSTSSIKVALNGGTYNNYSSTATYALNYGLNILDIEVGGSHYYVNVYRNYASDNIVVSTQFITVDKGSSQQIAAYNINGNNFCKLRDVAQLMKGTKKQFSVLYTNASNLVTMASNGTYVSIGGELVIPGAYTRAVRTNQTLLLNNSYVYPTAYNIDGYNYFLLRDLAALFDFNVTFSGNTVSIDTAKPYGDNASSSSSSTSKGDFDGISMKLVGDKGGTYLSTNKFDPDETEYDIDIKSTEKEIELYIYYDDDDYTISSVKFDKSTRDVSKSSKSTYDIYTIELDPSDLDDTELTVTVKNDDGDTETWTFILNEY